MIRSLYAYSLVPVLAVALLLFFTAALRTRGSRGLAAYCLAVAVWCSTLLGVFSSVTAPWAERLVASGAFIVAGYLHVAYDVIGAKDRRLVVFAYVVAAVMTAASAFFPGVVYNPVTLEAGPMFWPTMALAIIANAVPSIELLRAYRSASPARRPLLSRLLIAGVLCSTGGMTNATLLAHGHAIPIGMFLVLVSLLVLADVVREHEHPAERRLMERSLGWALVTASLSALVVTVILRVTTAVVLDASAFFVLLMALLAIEPLKHRVQELVTKRLVRGPNAAELARALEAEEERSERAGRMAEVGTLVSAVAHEVRNPLGVLSAHVKLLATSGVEQELLTPMKEQIDRAARFVDDLLRYGRPRPIEPRTVELAPLIDLSVSHARAALGSEAPSVQIEQAVPEGLSIEADHAQLEQVMIILIENALLAMREKGSKLILVAALSGDRVHITVDDDGPGIAAEIRPRLFTPFVSGRKREGTRPGTGLGLATARRVIERHGGTVVAETSPLGGARFVVDLPRRPPLLAKD